MRRFFSAGDLSAIVKERQALVRKYSRPLLMQIHPDFFASDVTRRSVNEASMQTLNTHLTHIKTVTADTVLPESLLSEFWQKPLGFSFYLRKSPATLIQHVTAPLGSAAGKKLLRINPRYPTQFYCDRITLAFLDLCHQADVSIPENATVALKERVDAMQQLALNGTSNSSNQVLEWRKTFERELRNDAGRISVGDKENADPNASMREMLDFFRNHPKFYFDQSLSMEEKTIAMVSFWEHIDALDYDRWRHLPVLFRRAYSRRDSGFLTIPFDFDPIGELF